jgi:hypothetical protein
MKLFHYHAIYIGDLESSEIYESVCEISFLFFFFWLTLPKAIITTAT